MMRKICIFCETWESGGIESFLNNILQHMDLDGILVDIVAAELRESVFTKGLQNIGVHFEELSGKLYALKENYRLFNKLLIERHYDVLHLNVYQGMTLYYMELARRAGVPVRIAHSHNTALRKSVLRSAKLLLHQVYRSRYTACATDLWACSRQAASFLFPLKELNKRGYQFIPNGIDTERFRFQQDVRGEVRRELGLDGMFVIGNVGRLCYQKNQMFLLDVMAEVLKAKPESVLLLVGEGEDREALREKARKLSIDKRVIFYGTSDHVERLFWAMDVFAFPSRFEGLGVVAIEAQCAGVPVVCSEHVPEEARVAGGVEQLPLNTGKVRWSYAMLHAAQQADRRSCADSVNRAGFGVQNVSKQIQSCYMR